MIKELAIATGISRHTLDNYFNTRERIPTADVAVKIAQALGVTVEYLVTGDDTQNYIIEPELKNLVQNFRALSEDDQKMILAITQLYRDKY